MPSYLLDTNVLLRALDETSPHRAAAQAAVAALLSRGEDCFLTGQVLIESWAVATRPADANGLGWTLEVAEAQLRKLRARFLWLDDRAEVFPAWLELVCRRRISGKHAHDGRLAALMQVHGISHLLTFNTADFPPELGVTAVDPNGVR